MKATLRLYSPHPEQLRFHSSPARFRVASWGRQAGKSTACLNELLKRAWEQPNAMFWFISPTYDQAKGQYRRLVTMLSTCPEIMTKNNQTELRVQLVNGSEIVFKSGEVGENLRGATLHGVVIDEVRDQSPELWPMLIRPMLTTTKGWAAFVSTPRGYDSFYDLAERARIEKDWAFFSAPSTCNPLFMADEFEAAKREMSESEFAQEIMAEFRDIYSGSAYVNFSEENCKDFNPWAPKGQLMQPYQSVIVALDFNLSPMAWTLGQQFGEATYWFDEIYLKKSHTQEAALELIARLKRLPMKATPQVILIGDATGKAGQRAAAGKSDYAILEEMLTQAGISYENRTPDSNPLVRDRVNIVNARLKAADGTRHLFLNPVTCPKLKRDLQRVSWKPGASHTLDQTTNPDLTHASDGVGYVLCVLTRLFQAPPGRLHMLRRT